MDCCNGLLLFLHGSACPPYGRARRRGLPPHSDVFFVCNPITKRWVALPECPETKRWFDCILVFDPRSSPHFKAIRIGFLSPTCLELTTFCAKTGFWIKSNVTTAPLRCRLSSRGIVSPDGIVYRLAPLRRLLRINIVDGSVMETVLPEKWRWPPCFGLFHGNVHYALFLDGCQLRIWELKDFDANEWVLKHSNCLEAELQQKFGWFRRVSNETMEEICSFSEQYHLIGQLKAHPFVPCFLDCLDEMQNNQ
ncbi:uncharacterized protein [Aristolochia californica]|uniref:uncharacterized protein n=1 Tax=Aristolochia californica TaxID=171875 RepID=UPI0035D86D02